jgi:hypothetical protein
MMKILKTHTIFLILLIGIFSFTKVKNSDNELSLVDIDVIELLSRQEFECRPSS